MRKFFHIVLMSVMTFAGCQTIVERDRPNAIRFRDSHPVETTALIEALLDLQGVCVQSVAGSWKDNVFAAEMVMKGEGEKMSIVFLAPQMRLATVTLTRPHHVRFERAPQIPQSLEPEYLLADFAFINLETSVLQRACGRQMKISDDGKVRHVALENGTLLAELTRQDDGTERYRNLVYGYDYVLQTEQRTLTTRGARP